jgi:NADPH-dependent ferric siderophore reductase
MIYGACSPRLTTAATVGMRVSRADLPGLTAAGEGPIVFGMSSAPNPSPSITRVRHEAKRRNLTVTRLERLAPTMLRTVLGGMELAGFTSLGFDDHVKLFFPAEAAPVMRDFTPRHYDAAAGELWIDFYLHETGPAATWAAQVAVGHTVVVGGPRGSALISLEGIDSHVLIGDETALPAIGRRLAELPPNTSALVLRESDGGAKSYPLQSRAPVKVVEVARDGQGAAPAQEIIETLRNLTLPAGRCFIWVATESQAARAIRRYLTDERGLDRHWIKAAGYWQRGTSGTHDRIHDDR